MIRQKNVNPHIFFSFIKLDDTAFEASLPQPDA